MCFYRVYYIVLKGFCVYSYYLFELKSYDEVAEWLRRWTANPMCSARVGSNPILVAILLHIFPLRCVDPTELGTYSSALRCQKCQKGHITTKDPSKMESKWKCDSCKCQMECQTVQKITNGKYNFKTQYNQVILVLFMPHYM